MTEKIKVNGEVFRIVEKKNNQVCLQNKNGDDLGYFLIKENGELETKKMG